MLGVMLFTAAIVASGQAATDHAKPVCQNVAPQLANAGKSAGAQRLNQLPNAKLVLGVVRMENWCSRPVVVRYDIGSAPKGR